MLHNLIQTFMKWMILSCEGCAYRQIWVDNEIYWTLQHTIHDCTLQITVLHTSAHKPTHAQVCMRTHTCTHARTHARTRTHTHTHVCAHVSLVTVFTSLLVTTSTGGLSPTLGSWTLLHPQHLLTNQLTGGSSRLYITSWRGLHRKLHSTL
jgi:hypothetical protein